MNKNQLLEMMDQRVERLIKEIEDENGPTKLVRKLSYSNPEAFTAHNKGSRDDLTEQFSEWEDELISMYRDIDSYVEDFKLSRDEGISL
jgi:hypothetical protein